MDCEELGRGITINSTKNNNLPYVDDTTPMAASGRACITNEGKKYIRQSSN